MITHQTSFEDFSLTRSGVLHNVLRRLKLADVTTKDYLIRSAVISGATWLPLSILAILQGVAWGDKVEVTFFKDFATHTRLLVIIPLLVFAERSVDFRLKELTTQFFTAGILNDSDVPRYEEIKEKMNRLSESLLADLVIFSIVAVNIVLRVKSASSELSIWLYLPGSDHPISWAGIWALCFSLAVFQYLLLRWVWRWVIWVLYFKKIADMPLKLNVAHPDLAGGIGFLGMPPGPFLPVTLVLSVILSTVIAQQIFFLHRKLPEYYVVIGVFTLFLIVLNVLPLLVFLKPLIKRRRKGIFKFSAMLQHHHRQFNEKWLQKDWDQEKLLGIPEASSMTDLNASFETALHMRIFPFNLRTMVSTILVSILPMIPLLAFEYRWADLLQQMFKMLL